MGPPVARGACAPACRGDDPRIRSAGRLRSQSRLAARPPESGAILQLFLQAFGTPREKSRKELHGRLQFRACCNSAGCSGAVRDVSPRRQPAEAKNGSDRQRPPVKPATSLPTSSFDYRTENTARGRVVEDAAEGAL